MQNCSMGTRGHQGGGAVNSDGARTHVPNASNGPNDPNA
jgi:hypothetical protein